MSNDPANGPWHLDKRIPIVQIIALWGALLVQTFAAGLYVASQDARVTALEDWIKENKTYPNRLMVLENEIKHVNSTLLRIEGLIKRPIDERDDYPR